MKTVLRAFLSAACVLSAAAPASACCLWPFGGWWSAGYSSGYGYGAGYPVYAASYSPSVGYYSAGYASSACCVPSCCDPCGGSACGAGSCVGTTSSGTLKPSADDKFDRKEYEDQLERDREKLRDPDRDRDTDDTTDSFRSGSGMGSGSGETFGADPVDGIGNKPPMGDVVPEAGTESKEPEPFLENKATEPQANRNNSNRPVAHTAGMLHQASGMRRLASRSLPASPVKTTSFAGKSTEENNRQPAAVRWISVPAPESQVRL